METKSRPLVYPEMIAFRTDSTNRLQLTRLASRAKVPVSALLRDLIAREWATRGPATKSVAAVAAQSSNGAAK